MNDEQLIFEKYLQTINLLSEAEYESKYQTSQGKGRTPYTALQREKILNQYYKFLKEMSFEMGDYIDLKDPNILGSLENVIKFLNTVGYSPRTQSMFNEYPTKDIGITPIYYLPNAINSIREFKKQKVYTNPKIKNLVDKVLNAYETYYKTDEVTKDRYREDGPLPMWTTLPLYFDKTTGKPRAKLFGAHNPQRTARTVYMRTAPDKLINYLNDFYGEYGLSFSNQHTAPDLKKNPEDIEGKTTAIDRVMGRTPGSSEPTPKNKVTNKPTKKPAKKPAKKPKREVAKESFIRDDIAF